MITDFQDLETAYGLADSIVKAMFAHSEIMQEGAAVVQWLSLWTCT